METYRQISLDVQVRKVPFAQVFYPFVLALLLFCAHAWGACRYVDRTGYFIDYACYDTRPSTSYLQDNACYLTSGGTTRNIGLACTSVEYPVALSCEKNCNAQRHGAPNIKGYCCSTQAEVDSVNCVINPTAEGCIVETDTTIFYCKNEYSLEKQTWRSYIFKCDCKSANGEITGCYGKQNVDVASDCTPYKSFDGDCSQNGYENGANAAKDSTGANADCWAVIGSTCHMRDKASGNTFRCECDGSCQVALRNLLAGNADCENPYPQPQQNDTLHIGSSASSSPSSSGGGSSPSSSEGSSEPSSSEGGISSSSLYDPWSPLLEDIKANTQGANNYLNNIQNNTETANSLLQAIVNKDWNPTINVQPPVVNVAGDTNIINVEVTGDTATAPAKIYDFLRDTSGIDGYADQFDDENAEWIARADSIRAAVGVFLDSMAVEDTSWIKHGEDVDSALAQSVALRRAYMDTIRNSVFNDTIQEWTNKIVNNGVITGEGSNACPSLLTRHHTLTIGNVTTDVGSLGGVLCEPIAGLNVTIWALARTFLRFMVAFGCMCWLYLEVMGIDTTGRGDD